VPSLLLSVDLIIFFINLQKSLYFRDCYKVTKVYILEILLVQESDDLVNMVTNTKFIAANDHGCIQ
jgi:hypothetical protein